MSSKNPGRALKTSDVKYGGNTKENSEHLVRRVLGLKGNQSGVAANGAVRIGIVRQAGRIEAARIVCSAAADAAEDVSAVFQRVRGGTTTAISAATVIDDTVDAGTYVEGVLIPAALDVLPGDVIQMTLTVTSQTNLVNLYAEVDYL